MSDRQREKIRSRVQSVKNDVVQFLRDIVTIPSPSGSEEQVVRRIRQEMEQLGYDRVWIDGMGNLVGKMGSGKKVIAFDGHADTVGIGDRTQWKHDPYSGAFREGIVYGRGASDQKGGLAAAVHAGRIIRDLGMPPDVSVLVVASVLEEDFEGLCWRYMIEEGGIEPHAVVLTEPSDGEIKIGQRGRMEIQVEVKGISCHGSAPERGENAIYKMVPVIEEVERLNDSLVSPSVLGKGSVVATDIKSFSPSLCAVPDRAVIHLDRRLSKGETLESSIKEIKDLDSVMEISGAVSVPEYDISSYTGLSIPVKAYYPAWLMDQKDPLVQSAVAAFEGQFKRKAPVGVWTFSTNGVMTRGEFQIPSIGFGPGEEKYAHTPNDQVSVSDVLKAMEFYIAFILNQSSE